MNQQSQENQMNQMNQVGQHCQAGRPGQVNQNETGIRFHSDCCIYNDGAFRKQYLYEGDA